MSSRGMPTGVAPPTFKLRNIIQSFGLNALFGTTDRWKIFMIFGTLNDWSLLEIRLIENSIKRLAKYNLSLI
jgi:hypothetical protein